MFWTISALVDSSVKKKGLVNELGNFNHEVGPVFLFVIIKNFVVALVTSCSLPCPYFTM